MNKKLFAHTLDAVANVDPSLTPTEMVEDRKSLGWDLPESRNVSLDINGFIYNGNDKTPKRYWGKLINEISDDRIAYLKNLDVIDSERRPASEANKKIKHTQDELEKFISDLS